MRLPAQTLPFKEQISEATGTNETTKRSMTGSDDGCRRPTTWAIFARGLK